LTFDVAIIIIITLLALLIYNAIPGEFLRHSSLLIYRGLNAGLLLPSCKLVVIYHRGRNSISFFQVEINQ